jgi:prepilin-type N-terminal cleavage/methylation domain-containing protein
MLVFFKKPDCNKGVMSTRIKRQNGFVLMEFLIVVAVMGIFGSIVFSFGKKVFDRVHSFADKIHLTCLVTDYLSARDNGRLDLANVKNTVDFAVALARADGSNEISAYQSQKRRNKQQKEILISGEKIPI